MALGMVLWPRMMPRAGWLAAASMPMTIVSALILTAMAATLPQPAGRPLLEISGRITASNRNGAAVLDRAMLEGLGLRTLRTRTAWTDGIKVFEGVLIRDLLAAVGAERATTMRAVALNDYVVDIPLSDVQRYDVLIALRMDGRELTARDKGPLWIVYPRDQFGELQDERYDARWVWQLKQLILS